MKALTSRQNEILEFIKLYIKDNKYPPSIRDISSNFQISVRGAYDHVKALERKMMIRFNENRSRAIEVIDKDEDKAEKVVRVPILGKVAAGVPLFAEENYDGNISVPASYLGKGKHFALFVHGDSMVGAGIYDGDVAVFIHQPSADNGNIVVAMIDDSVTLKRFYMEKNRIRLKAENPAYPPLYTQNVRVLGKLACIIRQYE